MDEDIKKNLKKLAQKGEVKVTRSILRWKYKKEGQPKPVDHQLERRSEEIASQAHEVVSRRGRKVWDELIEPGVFINSFKNQVLFIHKIIENKLYNVTIYQPQLSSTSRFFSEIDPRNTLG